MPDLVQITSPGGIKLTVAKDAAEAFSGLLADLESGGYKINQDQSGGYNDRNIAGTNTPSQHAFGHAVDINWQDNPRGAKTPSNLPPNIGDIAAAHGLTWGGNWSGDTRDPMHFELGGKPVQVASNDDLLARMNRIAPPQASQTATDAGGPSTSQGGAQDTAPSSDDLLTRMNAIAPPQVSASSTKPPPPGPPEADAPAWMWRGPTMPATTLPGPGVPGADQQSAETGLPLPQSPPPNLPQGGSNLANALDPAAGTTYASILPIARDDKTGEIRYGVLPSLPREMLQGTVQGIRDIFSGNVGAETAVDPATGKIRYGMTPGANLLLGAGVRPLAFSGPHPLQFVPPGTFDAKAPLSPQFTASPMATELEARLRGDTTAGANRLAAGPSTPTGVPTAAPQPAVPSPSGGPMATSQATPGAPQPTGAQVTPTTSDAAKAISSAYYKTFDKAAQDGGSLTPQATNKFIASVEAAAPSPGIGQAVAGKNAITELVDRLQPYKDQPMSLQDAQVVDQQLGNLISAEYGRTGVSPIGRQLQGIQQDFRDQLSNPAVGDVAGGQAGLDALAPARKAYAQAMKMDTIERIQERANMTDNPTTSFRTQIRTLLSNDRLSRGFSNEEKAALQDAARRGAAGTALHILGSRLIPIISGASGGGFVGSAIGATVGYGLNEAARAGENALAARRLQNAYTVLGKSVPPNPLQPQ